MIKILYIEQNPKISAIYIMKLEAEFAAEVIHVKDAVSAKEAFDSQQNIVFVLSDFDEILDVNGGLYKHIKESEKKIPTILLGNNQLGQYPELWTFDKDNPVNRQINTPIDQDEFTRTLVKVVQGTEYAYQLDSIPEKEYAPVPTNNFSFFNKLPVDVFIKLSDVKHVRLVKEGEMYPSDIIKKYEVKGVKHLFVRDYQYKALADISIKNLLKLYDKKSLKADQKQAIQMMAVESIHEKIQEMGLTEETIKLTKSTLEASVSVAKRSPNIWGLLKKMKQSGNYIYDHSLRLSYLCTAVCKFTDWNSDSTLYKLSLASLMHDMTLDDHNIARIQSINDPKLKEFNPEAVERYKKHPIEAAEMVKANKDLPRDVHFIIMQHHERPDGTGFPLGMSKLRIAPLSCIFIICHEFLERLDALGEDVTDQVRSSVITELKAEYLTGNFRKPFNGLMQLFGEGNHGSIVVKDK